MFELFEILDIFLCFYFYDIQRIVNIIENEVQIYIYMRERGYCL